VTFPASLPSGFLSQHFGGFFLPGRSAESSLQILKLGKLANKKAHAFGTGPLIYIHFVIGDCDWVISEYDGEDLFFGYAIIGNATLAEWGYISFTELKQIKVPPGIEVDYELFDPSLKASEIEEIRPY